LRKPGVTIVSGWLAEPRQNSHAQRQFTQHWWNFDQRSSEYFDISPEIEKGAIYTLMATQTPPPLATSNSPT
jgi:hypothetical protein